MRIACGSRLACLAILSAPVPVAAGTPVVQPIQIGSETVRYQQGVATVDLRLQRGAVQIRPLPLDHGSLAFSVAVFNGANVPANIDSTSFEGQAGEQHLAVFSVNQLAKKAKSRAMWKQIGLAALGGLAAGAAASQRDTYSGTVHTPYGAYTSYYSAPSAIGQLQSMAIAAGTGVGIAQIRNNLDRTLEALGNDVVRMSTIDPGQTYGGKIA